MKESVGCARLGLLVGPAMKGRVRLLRPEAVISVLFRVGIQNDRRHLTQHAPAVGLGKAGMAGISGSSANRAADDDDDDDERKAASASCNGGRSATT